MAHGDREGDVSIQSPLLFDRDLAQELCLRGIDTAVSSRISLVHLAKTLARFRAMNSHTGTTNIDEIQDMLIKLGHPPDSLGNAAGAIFRGKQWERCGWKISERVSNHARLISTWRLLR